jgi:hypothetical protein
VELTASSECADACEFSATENLTNVNPRLRLRPNNLPVPKARRFRSEKKQKGEKRFVKTTFLLGAVAAAGMSLCGAMQAQGQVKLIAKGQLTESSAGLFADLSGLDYNLENGAPANLLGGLGSALTWGYGDTFLALPDRGPNAVPFDSLVDDTVSYVPRFHTIKMNLQPSSGALPFTLTPTLEKDDAAVQPLASDV